MTSPTTAPATSTFTERRTRLPASLHTVQALGPARGGRGLRIGLVAPPWAPVPPVGYGGIELMIDALARGLAARGHDVRLFTVGTSTCPVRRDWLHQEPPARIGDDLAGLSHVLAAYDRLAQWDCE